MKIAILLILMVVLAYNVYGVCTSDDVDIINANTMIYYNFSDTSLPLKDQMGNVNLISGSFTGRVVRSWGYGWDFEASSSQWVYSAYNNFLKSNNIYNYTLGFFFIPEGSGNGGFGFASVGQYYSAPNWYGCGFYKDDSTDVVYFYCYQGSGSTNYHSDSIETIDDGKAYYLAFMPDEAEPRIYINGTEVTYSAQTTGTLNYMTNGQRIGINNYWGTNYADGVYGSWILINRSINPDCIEEVLMTQSYPFVYSGDTIISDVVCTSPDPDDDTEPYETGDITPTFTLSTSTDANCSIGIDNATWTACATTGSTGHVCTDPYELMNFGTDYVYINCTSGLFETIIELEMMMTNYNRIYFNYTSKDYGYQLPNDICWNTHTMGTFCLSIMNSSGSGSDDQTLSFSDGNITIETGNSINITSVCDWCEAGSGNTTEEMQDAVMAAIDDGTQTHITVTYEDGTNDMDFVVSDDWWDACEDAYACDWWDECTDADDDGCDWVTSAEVPGLETDANHDECSEIANCVENAYDSLSDFTGALTDDKICTYDMVNDIINCTYTDQSASFTYSDYFNQDLNTTNNATFLSLSLGDASKATEDIYLYFSDDAANDEYIAWSNSMDLFLFSDRAYIYGLDVAGDLTTTNPIQSGSDIYTTGAGDDLWLGTVTQASANFQAYANGSLRAKDINSTRLSTTTICLLGDTCETSWPGFTYSDYFDQDLNTTDAVEFENLTVLDYVTISEQGLHLGNASNTTENIYLYFSDDTATDEYLMWSDSVNRFSLSDDIYVSGYVSASGYIYAGGNLYTGGDLYTTGAGNDLWLGTVTQASANFQAYANGSVRAKDINSTKISATTICLLGDTCETSWPESFTYSDYFNQDLNTTDKPKFENLTLGLDIDGEDIYLYFSDDAPNDEYIMWNNAGDRFDVSDFLYVSSSLYGATVYGGTVYSNGKLYTTGVGDDLFLGTSTQANALFQALANGSVRAKDINGTRISATTICLLGDTCETSWPAGTFTYSDYFNQDLNTTSNVTFKNATVDYLCLSGDTCESSWPVGGAFDYDTYFDQDLNTTDKPKFENLTLGLDIDGEDIYLYFSDDAPNDEYIMWNNTQDRFEFSDRVYSADFYGLAFTGTSLTMYGDIKTTGASEDLWLGNLNQGAALFRAYANGSLRTKDINATKVYANEFYDNGVLLTDTTNTTRADLMWANITDYLKDTNETTRVNELWTNSTHWETAYNWGDHSIQGYLTSVPSVNKTTNFGGEVSGTYDNIVIDDNALDDRYFNITGGQMTGNLNMTNNNITGIDCLIGTNGGTWCFV